jgi:hypothetical protein
MRARILAPPRSRACLHTRQAADVDRGGAFVSGGIADVVPEASIQLSAESTIGWGSPAARWEIYAFPVGFTEPAGWSTDVDSGAYYYLGNGNPPAFNAPTLALWGKLLFRLRVLNGVLNNVENPALTDETSGISVLSAHDLEDIARRETTQFDAGLAWIGAFQRDLRRMEAIVAATATNDSKAAVRCATTSTMNFTRSGNTLTCNVNGALASIDGVSLALNDRCLFKDQATGAGREIYYFTDSASVGTPAIAGRTSTTTRTCGHVVHARGRGHRQRRVALATHRSS